MIHTEFALRLAQQHATELQTVNRRNAIRHAHYPDSERQPRIARHWANRF